MPRTARSRERPRTRVCFLDIETTGIDADSAIVTGVGLLEEDGRFRFIQVERPEEEKKRLAEALRLLEKYDVIFTWRGRDFDLPFIATRAIKHGLDPRPLYETMHVDLAEIAKNHLKLSRTDLYTIARFLGVQKDTKTHGKDMPLAYIESLAKTRRGAWSRIKQHCRDDLVTLMLVYRRLKPLLRILKPELAL